MERKAHWENIYRTKKLTEVSWYEPFPEISLEFIEELDLEKSAGIIDVGSGDSFLVDFLLAGAYTNLSVLDISEEAIERVQNRLGEKAGAVDWIITDITGFKPRKKYTLWHDRAAFHFLTEAGQIEKYLNIMKDAVAPGGYIVLATFSENGPTKCSGINIRQYSTEELKKLLAPQFENLKCRNVSHRTPSGAIQDFSFCSFQRK